LFNIIAQYEVCLYNTSTFKIVGEPPTQVGHQEAGAHRRNMQLTTMICVSFFSSHQIHKLFMLSSSCNNYEYSVPGNVFRIESRVDNDVHAKGQRKLGERIRFHRIVRIS
jgi:hypothetical protein